MCKPQALRVRLADHEAEMITSLKDLPARPAPARIPRSAWRQTRSAVFTCDIGTQEIYALAVKRP
jgi:hypothetical protein